MGAPLPDEYEMECVLQEAAFVHGAQSCREMLARFVEQGGTEAERNIACSIRANWHPGWGVDPGPLPGSIPHNAFGETAESDKLVEEMIREVANDAQPEAQLKQGPQGSASGDEGNLPGVRQAGNPSLDEGNAQGRIEALIYALELASATLGYVADFTCINLSGDWVLKDGYDPQNVLDAIALAAAAREGGDVQQAPGEAPQSGGVSRNAQTPSVSPKGSSQ